MDSVESGYFNARLRAMGIRDSCGPKETGCFVPAAKGNTDRRWVNSGGAWCCKGAIQANNVDPNDRGWISLACLC